MWDVDPQDWRRPGVSVIARTVLANMENGDVVLLQTAADRWQTVAALNQILGTMTAAGLPVRRDAVVASATVEEASTTKRAADEESKEPRYSSAAARLPRRKRLAASERAVAFGRHYPTDAV